MYSSVFCFDYNWAALLLTLIILYVELNHDEEINVNLKKDLFLGVLVRISNSFKTNNRNNFSSYFRWI